METTNVPEECTVQEAAELLRQRGVTVSERHLQRLCQNKELKSETRKFPAANGQMQWQHVINVSSLFTFYHHALNQQNVSEFSSTNETPHNEKIRKSTYETKYEMDRMDYASILIRQTLEQERASAMLHASRVALGYSDTEKSEGIPQREIDALFDLSERRAKILLKQLHGVLHAD